MNPTFRSWYLSALLGLAIGLAAATSEDSNRQKRLFSVFSVVKFNNDPCDGNNNRNGTCYTAQECEDRGGTPSGSCAESYGVCCTLSVGCGGRSSENNTYFEEQNPTSGSCTATICPCDDSICQFRLDFNTFVISGPSTNSLAVGFAIKGGLSKAAGVSVTQGTQCLTDTFAASSNGRHNPAICGTNTGEHMYIDADSACNELHFNFGNNGVGTSISANRGFNIKVTQLECTHPNRAPEGCTQYFYGDSAGVIRSYNYDGGVHLGNQDQNICIRREKGNCRICYAAVTPDADFMLSGTTAKSGFTDFTKQCCGYGTDGAYASGFDCIQIPGVLEKKTVGSALTAIGPHFCGRKLGTVKSMPSMTVCQVGSNFNVRFLSDAFETTDGAAIGEGSKIGAGFRLAYTQGSC